MVRPTDHQDDPTIEIVNESSTSPSTVDPSIVARSYLASFRSGDPELISSHVSADFVNEHTAAIGTGCVGRDAYQERLPNFLGDMVDLDYSIEHLLVDGNNVAAFYTMTARWQGDAPISVRGIQRLHIQDGLITHRTDYWDSAVFLKQASPEASEALRAFGI